jgi:hypothetical protein
MNDDKANLKKPPQDSSKATPKDKKLDQIADEAAEQAGKTERRYDEDHEIFTE